MWMMHTRNHETNRRGLVLIVALITLVLVTAVGLAILRVALTGRATERRMDDRQQARWLAESAWLRTSEELRDDPEFASTNWSVPAEYFGPRGRPGHVEIVVEPRDEERSAWQITIVADYPAEGIRRTRYRIARILERSNADPSTSTDPDRPASPEPTTETPHP